MFGRLLAGADRLIAPSRDVARRIGRYFPDLRIEVWPHPEPKAPVVPRIVRVAILGNLSPEKGLRVVAACAADAKARSLPLVFRVIGSTTEPVPQSPAAPLTIHGQYDDAELASLLAAEKPDVIWFPAQVPETYSYTLSVALASGLPIVASALGAFPERLSGHPRSVDVPWNAPPAVWNAALQDAAGVATARPAAPGRATRRAAVMDPARYLAQYLAPLPAAPRRATAIADALALPDHHFHPVHVAVEAPDLTLPQLYVAGVECGHGEARAELKRRVEVVAAQLDEYRAVRDRAQGDRQELAAQLLVAQRQYLLMQVQAGEMQAHIGKLQNHAAHLDTALAAARERIDEIELSTTWRMTAPIRTAGHRAKILLARGRGAWSDVQQLPRRAGLARSILRDEGPVALAQRVRSKVTPRRPVSADRRRRAPAGGGGAPARTCRRPRPARRTCRSSSPSTASRC